MDGDVSSGLQTPWAGLQESKIITAAVAGSIREAPLFDEPQRGIASFVSQVLKYEFSGLAHGGGLFIVTAFEFSSVVEAVRCARQNAIAKHSAGVPGIVALSSGLAFTWVTSCRSTMAT
ncbi:hypothetical protein X767_14710 [Mesorhizobium sp. LSJC264A00]|nr:hypothetical protein X767_14710 [Mesorhizobium sp. LSJC264A00]